MQRSIIAPAERVTNLRWGMAALVAVAVFTASLYGTYTGIDGTGRLTTIALDWAFAIALLPVGIAIDRIGVRIVAIVGSALWGIASLAVAFVDGSSLAASIALGLAAATFPVVAAKATAGWFPLIERGMATALFVAAASLPFGLYATRSPFAFVVPHLFVVGGTLGVIVAIVFAIAYRSPDDSRVTYAERTYIERGSAQPSETPVATATLLSLVRARKIWAMAVGFGAAGYAFGAGAILIARTSGDPYVWIASLAFGGGLVDVLVRRNGARFRKSILAVGFTAACAVLGATVHNAFIAGTCIELAVAGYATVMAIVWSIPGLIAPRGAVGSVAAIGALALTIGTAGALAGDGSAEATALAAIISGACFLAGLGRIEPVDAPV